MPLMFASSLLKGIIKACMILIHIKRHLTHQKIVYQTRKIKNLEVQYFLSVCDAWGATRMARGGIRLVPGLTKSTLIMYNLGMKKDPKYVFLHAFFLICLSCSFQNLSI